MCGTRSFGLGHASVVRRMSRLERETNGSYAATDSTGHHHHRRHAVEGHAYSQHPSIIRPPHNFLVSQCSHLAWHEEPTVARVGHAPAHFTPSGGGSHTAAHSSDDANPEPRVDRLFFQLAPAQPSVDQAGADVRRTPASNKTVSICQPAPPHHGGAWVWAVTGHWLYTRRARHTPGHAALTASARTMRSYETAATASSATSALFLVGSTSVLAASTLSTAPTATTAFASSVPVGVGSFTRAAVGGGWCVPRPARPACVRGHRPADRRAAGAGRCRASPTMVHFRVECTLPLPADLFWEVHF